MPYIPKERRTELELLAKQANGISEIGENCMSAGELNFVITKILLGYLNKTGKSYSRYNEVVGVLECVGQELYRRKIVIYENKKKDENGDVYEN